MITIRPARDGDLDGFLTLAAQVEHWFGPMVEEPGFHRAVEAHIRTGAALIAEAMLRYVSGPGTVEVVTFGPDHPGAVESGARAFYEKLGFAPGEPTEPGPEGGSRQIYRLDVPADVRAV
ncbi:GNAT family N-acetyltransferase [Streptomyces parvus]